MKKNKLEERLEILNSKSVEELQEMANQYDILSLEKIEEKELKRRLAPIEEQLKSVETRLEIANKSLEYMNDEEKINEKMSEISSLNKEKENLIKLKEKEQEQIKLDTKRRQVDKRDIQNYLKNKDKILQVKNYRDKLIQKNEILKEEKKLHTEKLEQLRKESKHDLEEISKLQEKIEKKLEKSEEMTNQEYNDVLIEKEKLEKTKEEKVKKAEELKKLEAKINQMDKKIIATNQAISKCDLVWKNLFLGKSWDDIHVKALRMNEQEKAKQRFTSKEKTVISKSTENKEEQAEQENKEQQTESKNKEEQTKKENEETKVPFLERHPKLASIFNSLKSILPNKTKKLPTPEKIIAQTEKQIEEQEKQIKEQESQTVNSTSNNKDAFIEKLKVMVDREESKRENREEIEKIKASIQNQKNINSIEAAKMAYIERRKNRGSKVSNEYFEKSQELRSKMNDELKDIMHNDDGDAR